MIQKLGRLYQKQNQNQDDLSCPGVNEDTLFNPKCMTLSVWIEAQSKDKIVGNIIKMYKAKEMQYWRGKETDNQ